MSARKKVKNNSILSGTPTQQASLSPSRKQTMKSPVSTSKYLAQSNNKPKVSYGELQIVLQNIQQIRLKANNQVKALTLQNNQLKEQLASSQETVKGLNEQNYQKNRSQNDKKMIWQLQALQTNKVSLEAQLQQKQKRIIGLEVKNKELQKQIQSEMNKLQLKKKEVEEYKVKWKWAFSILAGNEERAEQMVWKVKNQFKGGLWTIIQTHSRKDQTADIKNQQILFLQKQIEKITQKLRQSSGALDRCNDQLNISKVKQQQARQNNEKLSGMCLQLQEQKKELQLIVQKSKAYIDQLKHSNSLKIKQQNKQIQKLQQQIHQKQIKLNQMRKKKEYQNLIAELCDDNQQSNQLLQRIRYLQKLRTQYFFNIQKIQFLCKHLDN